MIPTNKFLIPYGLLLVSTLSERIIDVSLSLDLFLVFGALVGIILIFNKRIKIAGVGYLLSIIPLISMLIYNERIYFNLSFWIPLILFMAISSVVLFKTFSSHQSKSEIS